MKDIPNRLKYTKRKDGFIVSTIISLDNRYGRYETAIRLEGLEHWKIAEGYNTEEEAIKGHEKYSNMREEEINKINYIG
jgi:hypothetical protein